MSKLTHKSKSALLIKKKTPSLFVLPKAVVIYAKLNGKPENARRVVGQTLDELLTRCTQTLKLTSAARKFYLEDGTLVESFDQIKEKMEVYVSQGEHFIDTGKLLRESITLKEMSFWGLNGLYIPKSKLKNVNSNIEMEKSNKMRRVLTFSSGDYLMSSSFEIVTDLRDIEKFKGLCGAKHEFNGQCKKIFSTDFLEIIDLKELLEKESYVWSPHREVVVLGPVWASSKDDIDKLAVNNYFKHILDSIKELVEKEKDLLSELNAMTNEDLDNVHSSTIKAYSKQELKLRTQDSEDKVKKLENDIHKFKRRFKDNSKNLSKETDNRPNQKSTSSFKTISGLRLMVYTNGHPPEKKVPFYFNIEQSKKGVNDESISFNRLLDELSKSAHLTKVNDHSKGCLVRRLFKEDGTEIKEISSLFYDQVVCISYGDDWINPHYLYLSKKAYFCNEDMEEIYIDSYKTKEYKLCEKMMEKPPLYNFPIFQHEKMYNSYLMIAVSLSERSSSDMNVETWSFTKNGRIFTKQFPSLSLTLCVDYKSTVKLSQLSSKYDEKFMDRDITCHVVQLYPEEATNSLQSWTFTTSGLFRNKGDPKLFLTYLPTKITPSHGTFSDNFISANICATEKLPKALVSNQRWGFKHLDQWKVCEHPNEEWHKAALIWPLKKDGSLNDELKWPLEGGLLVCAPPSNSNKIFSDSRFPIKLNVLKNNDHRSNKPILVTGPDLTKLIREHHEDKYETHCSNENLLRQEFEMFLVNCTGALRLSSVARRLFSKDGKELFILEGLSNNDHVFVSMGEMWCSPEKKLSIIQLRSYTNKLETDVERIKNFINFCDPSPDFVMGIQNNSLEESCQLEVQLLNDLSRRKLERICDENNHMNNPELIKEPSEDDNVRYKSIHEQTCEAAKLKYAKNQTLVPSLDLTATFIKEKERNLEKVSNLQEFVYDNYYILVFSNQRFSLYAEEVGKRVIFKRIILGDQNLQSKWIIHKSGLIESMYYRGYVLTISCPKMFPFQDHSSRGYLSSGVSLERAINTKYGNATQRFNLRNGFIYPFVTNSLDKSITSALISSICTRFVSTKEINQQGFIVNLKKSVDNSDKTLPICLSCVSVLNGRFPMTPIDYRKKSFMCSYSGGFKVIRNVNLTSEEADETYKFYERKLQDVKDQLIIKPCINRNVSKPIQNIRVLLYRNGFGRINAPLKVTGKSISEIMEVATNLFNLQRPVRILYTESGEAIQDELSFLNIMCNPVRTNLSQDQNISVINENVKKTSDEDEKTVQINLSSDGKYFIVEAEEGSSSTLYTLEILINKVNGLKQFCDKDGDSNLYFLFNYEIFNNQINTDLFSDEYEFESEITDFTLKSSEDDLRYLFNKDLRVLRMQLISATVDNPDAPQEDIKVDIKSINAFADVHLNWISEKISNIQKESVSKVLECPLISAETFKPTSSTLTIEITLKQCDDNVSVTTDSIIVEPSYLSNNTIELWASIGEAFCSPNKEAKKTQKTKMDHIKLQSYFKKYLLRTIKGDRIKKLNSGTLEATGDVKNPVKIKDNWMFPSKQEIDLIKQIKDLEGKLSERKSNTMNLTTPEVSRSLYSKKRLKHCYVYLNGDVECNSVSVWGETLYDIMHNAAGLLQMKKTPKYLFNNEGREIKNVEEITTKMSLALSSYSNFISPELSRLRCEIKANWGRARARYGDKSTELQVKYRPITVIDVDPFEPPEIMTSKEQVSNEFKIFKVFENGQPSSTASVISGNSFSNVLSKAAEVLGLESAVKCFYTLDGKRIINFKEILNDDVLAASVTGKGFMKNEN